MSMTKEEYDVLLYGMIGLAVIVFIVLYYVNAGYGMFQSARWGITINNRLGWIFMESPVFIIIFYFWVTSERKFQLPFIIFFLLFELHYFNRSFIFPFMMKSTSNMPVVIMCSAILFNFLNGTLQGEWIFRQSSTSQYDISWMWTPYFIIGTIIFIIGMAINLHSDWVIRNLREPGDTKHYLPEKGFYQYVLSANYFGEIVEWTGYALLSWSIAGAVFVLWTCANLIPRSNSIYRKYLDEFGPHRIGNRKRIIPFIY
ncbi:hypothetical protein DLAC_04360 [Tieghemostelium lacteum]|uniref:3-oxo-5-alpha-steroid 4-dehydrogenase 1 n=1 Tax=Tieghemostelium lacteum TaxID=361077 RepID=A0A151ZJL6_TIELA|nr:hypothetical protein DLAC_04360 [Tieghemostelium lacteum]|eukprot:KYQ94080.1 hypothetical protein DLAC_04360 [Tieghemostelium lacteum]